MTGTHVGGRDSLTQIGDREAAITPDHAPARIVRSTKRQASLKASWDVSQAMPTSVSRRGTPSLGPATDRLDSEIPVEILGHYHTDPTGKASAVMSDQEDWGFAGDDDAKMTIRAGVRYLPKGVPGSDRGDVTSEITEIVRQAVHDHLINPIRSTTICRADSLSLTLGVRW